MKDFAKYKIFLVMGGFHLIACLAFGYLIVSKFPGNVLAIIVEVLLALGIIFNYLFYRYFKKLYARIEN